MNENHDYAKEGVILYAKEVNAFLSSFNEPKSKIMEIISHEWKKHGFTPLEQLKKTIFSELMVKNDSGLVNSKKKDIYDGFIETSVERDDLTGFHPKTNCPLLTGLADLYGKSTGHTVIRIDGDFSNMGGTNEFFRSELQKQDGKGKRFKDGFKETDTLVSVTSAVTYMSFHNMVNEHNKDQKTPTAHLHSIRSGGDEIRFIITGLSNDAVKGAMENAEKKIKDLLKEGNLQIHDNPKDIRRPGFGLSLAMVDMCKISSPANVGLILDAKINDKKLLQSIPNLIEKTRITGNPDFLNMATKIHEDFNQVLKKELKAKGMSNEDIDSEIDKRNRSFAIQKNIANTPAPEISNDGAYVSSSLSFISSLSSNSDYAAFATLSNNNKSAASSGRHFSYDEMMSTHSSSMSFADKYSILENNLDTYIKQFGIKDKKDIFLIHRASDEIKSIDPNSDLKMVGELVNDAERYLSDAENIKKDHNLKNDTRIKLVHVEFTNLAGINDISHEHGDALLKDYGKIMKSSMEKMGLKDFDHGIYSEGGGKFKVMLPEFYEALDDKGNKVIKEINDKTLEEFAKNVKESVKKEINDSNIKDYFESKGLSTDFSKISNEKTKSVVSNPEAKMSEIPNPKRDFEKGVEACLNTGELRQSNLLSISDQIDVLTDTAERERRVDRENQKIREQRKSQIIDKLSSLKGKHLHISSPKAFTAHKNRDLGR